MSPTATLKIKENVHFQATITCLSQIKAISVIKDKLSPSQMEKFRETCFGHLLSIPQLKFCGNVVHSLLLREADCPRIKAEGMKFLVGGHLIRFSKQDFALITGLSFRERPDFEKHPLFWSHRLRDEYFVGSKTISMYTLQETFRNCQNEEDTVKLALVYLLEFLLLGKDKKTYIDLRFLQIVDDLDEFNKYPWGLVSYERTVYSLSAALKGRAEKFMEKLRRNPNHKNETYSLMGFPYAFQVWAYEKIPKLGESFAKRIHHANCPRILQWMCEATPMSSLQTTVFNSDKLDVSSLLPVVYEEQQQYLKVKEEDEEEEFDEQHIKELLNDDDEDTEEEEFNAKARKRAKVETERDDSKEVKQLREELTQVKRLLKKQGMEIEELREEILTQRQTLHSHALEMRAFRNLVMCQRMARRSGRG